MASSSGADSRSWLTRLPSIGGLLAAVVFTALSFSSNSATRFYQWPWFFYWQLLLATPIAILAFRLLFGDRLPRFGGALDAGLALMAAINFVAALLSPFRPQSLNGALIPLAAVSLAYLWLSWIEREPVRRTERIAWLGQFVGVLMALFVVVSLSRWWFALVLPRLEAGGSFREALSIRNPEPFGHSVYVAGFAVLAAPWLAVNGLLTRGWPRRFWLTCAMLALVTVSTTASRGGVVAAAFALICAAVFLWPSLNRITRALILIGVLLATGLLIALDPRLREFALHGKWSHIASESNQQREAMLEAGWLMGCDRPWIGFGSTAVSLVYPRYRVQLPGNLDDVLQLHCTPAQLWAELGAPGVLAGTLLIAGLIGLARRIGHAPRVAVRELQSHRLRAQAALTALTGYAVMCLFDYQFDVPMFAGIAATLLALGRASAAAALSERSASTASFAGPSQPALCALGVLLLSALAVITWFTVPNLRARQLFASAADAREAGDDDAFVAGAKKAAAAAPWEPFYVVQLASFYGENYLHAGKDPARASARDECITLLRHALVINPDQEYCQFNLGWLLLPADPADAEQHFRAAVRLSPDREGVCLGLGLSCFAQGKRATAAQACALEWFNHPRAMTSPLWDVSPLSVFRAEVATALRRLNQNWQKQPTLPFALRDQVRYVAALAEWWRGAATDTAALARLGTPEQQRFFLNLDAMEKRSYATADPAAPQPWEQLYIAWRDGVVPPDLKNEPARATALHRLFERHLSFRQLLTSAPADEPSLIIMQARREPPAYGVLQRNQDGFPLSDLYISPENLLAEKYLLFLFSQDDYLPGSLLLQSLP